MEAILNAIWNAPSLSTLPGQIAEGLLPALISGTSPALRAIIAAALHRKLQRPLLVVCSDESAAEHLRTDLRSLTGEEV